MATAKIQTHGFKQQSTNQWVKSQILCPLFIQSVFITSVSNQCCYLGNNITCSEYHLLLYFTWSDRKHCCLPSLQYLHIFQAEINLTCNISLVCSIFLEARLSFRHLSKCQSVIYRLFTGSNIWYLAKVIKPHISQKRGKPSEIWEPPWGRAKKFSPGWHQWETTRSTPHRQIRILEYVWTCTPVVWSAWADSQLIHNACSYGKAHNVQCLIHTFTQPEHIFSDSHFGAELNKDKAETNLSP